MEDRVWNKIDTRHLVYGGEWGDVKTTIRSSVFAAMMDLAQDRVTHYKSDLYHDAIWLSERIVGPMSFDWIVRDYGTFIGNVVTEIKDEDWTNSVRYRFEIYNEIGKWKLNIYEAGPLVVNVPDTNDPIINVLDINDPIVNVLDINDPIVNVLDINDPGCDVCGMHDRSEPCSALVEEEDFVLSEEFKPYFNDDPLPENVIRSIAEKVVRFCNEDPLPENVVKALVATDVNPINWTPEKVEKIVEKYSKEGERTFPTLRNDSTVNPSNKMDTRKVINMDSLLQELREKLDEANTARDEAYEAKDNLDSLVNDLEEYIEQVEALIDNLDELPSVSVDIDVSISFES